MLSNYFTIAWRNLKNNLVFSVMNIIGLSIGMACCLIMGLFAYQEYTYDTHHKNADRIYRVVNRQVEGTKSSYVAVTQGVLAPELVKNFSEVQDATRLGFITASVTLDNTEPVQERIMAVDPSYFRIFTIPLKQAPAGDTLMPQSILISEEAAVRLFGKKNPVGSTLSLGNDIHLKVNGVFENFPLKSHLYADFIVSFTWIEKTEPHAGSWNFNSYYNYVLMNEAFDERAFNKKLNDFVHRYTPASWKSFEYFLQPIRSINLQPGYAANPRGSIGKILVNGFIMVGLIILLLASFNYMNLATARSANRAIEVGVRKVVGAQRFQLVAQFLTESFILCSLGFFLAVFWADIGIQFFNAYTGLGLSLQTIFDDTTWMISLIVALLVITLVAGGYPALFLSRFVPAVVLKGHRSSNTSRKLRRGLVVFQFSLTSLLVVLVIIVIKQTQFMRSRDLGFNKERLLLFSADRNKDISVESFKSEFQKIPGVKQVAVTSHFPGMRTNSTSIWEQGKSEDESIKALWLFTDHEYIPVLELRLVAGRNFNANGNDENTGAIINENAAAAFGWTAEEAIGKRIVGFTFSDSLPGEIIGVIKDFHISPLRKEIMPLIIGYSTEQTGYLVRLEGNRLFETRGAIDKLGTRLTHGEAFESLFMEEALEESYGAERKTGEMLTFFTCLAILIGCSGLYALAAYEGEQRIKELGVRKIMGATTTQLLFLLSKDFLKLILIALFAALPLAYYVGNFWLRVYPYRISWTADIFIIAGTFILLLGWITIVWQALKASRLNPVEALRYE